MAVALYARVSTSKQAEKDLSIPDQRHQARAYCTSRGWEIVADYVEPGVSATHDRRPEFQRMIRRPSTKPPAFTAIVMHSFSWSFRDPFQLEFYVRRLAKNGVFDIRETLLMIGSVSEVKNLRRVTASNGHAGSSSVIAPILRNRSINCSSSAVIVPDGNRARR